MSPEILSPSEQLAKYLRTELLNGRWKDTLPGTPALASELGVDRKTITAAFKILESEGITEPQGVGRKRRIKLSGKDTRCLNINILLYEQSDLQTVFINQMLNKMKVAGHNVKIANRSLLDMGMDVDRVARHVKKQPADVWIVIAASREVLEWFAGQDTPAFAVFGRRRKVPIPSVGPDKEEAIRLVVQRLVEFGHKNIVYLAREERRKPNLGYLEHCYLDELKQHGIAIDITYNLPSWKNNTESFQQCLSTLLKHTWATPTAIILDESQLFVAALLQLPQAGLLVPQDVSLVCNDEQMLFDWCEPSVAHISWDETVLIDRVLMWIKQLSRHRNVRKLAYYTPAQFIEGGTIGPAPLCSKKAKRTRA